MKIATWNLKRPNFSSKKRNRLITEALQKIDADVLILTETNSIIHPGLAYKSCASPDLISQTGILYKLGENRVTVYTKYPILQTIATCDSLTSVCASIQTPQGNIVVYGTVIGIYGSRRKSFISELENQIAEWKKIVNSSTICIAGDFNISFSDNYYYTIEGRQKINKCLRR